MESITNPIIKGAAGGLIVGASLGALYGRYAGYMTTFAIGSILSPFSNMNEKEVVNFAKMGRKLGEKEGAKLGALIGMTLGISSFLTIQAVSSFFKKN